MRAEKKLSTPVTKKNVSKTRYAKCLHLILFINSITMKILIPALLFLSISAKAQLSCASKITVNFNFTGGVQTWAVPAGVTIITIKTRGATGGLAPTPANSAGGGAVMEADYTVVAGQIVTILVGGRGLNGNDNEAAGGGATGVYINGVLKLVAGGGGGEDNTGNGGNGQSGNNGTSTTGDNASNCGCTSPNNGLGGTGGAGGNHGEFACAVCTNGGGGGGGLNSAGQGNGNANAGRPGQQGNIAGAAGGLGSGDDAVGVNGGWGWAGGGGADDRESGGGGGYSGGGGGPEGFNPGGGGSFSDPTGRTASFTANGASTAIASDGLVTICYFNILPLTLQSFSGAAFGTYNLIKWKTADEYNIDRFVVERSEDGITFTSIGEVSPTNNGSGNSYEFRDNSLANSPKLFYRLRVIDRNRSEKYSSVILLRKNGNSEKLVIYPNPVSDNLFVSSSTRIIKIEILTVTGSIVYSNKLVNLTTPVSVSLLAKGIYILKAYTESEVIINRFVKK